MCPPSNLFILHPEHWNECQFIVYDLLNEHLSSILNPVKGRINTIFFKVICNLNTVSSYHFNSRPLQSA